MREDDLQRGIAHSSKAAQAIVHRCMLVEVDLNASMPDRSFTPEHTRLTLPKPACDSHRRYTAYSQATLSAIDPRLDLYDNMTSAVLLPRM